MYANENSMLPPRRPRNFVHRGLGPGGLGGRRSPATWELVPVETESHVAMDEARDVSNSETSARSSEEEVSSPESSGGLPYGASSFAISGYSPIDARPSGSLLKQF